MSRTTAKGTWLMNNTISSNSVTGKVNIIVTWSNLNFVKLGGVQTGAGSKYVNIKADDSTTYPTTIIFYGTGTGYHDESLSGSYVQLRESKNNTVLESYSKDEEHRTFTITGGEDVTNSSLISWLESNATFVSEYNVKDIFTEQMTELANSINAKAGSTGAKNIVELNDSVNSIMSRKEFIQKRSAAYLFTIPETTSLEGLFEYSDTEGLDNFHQMFANSQALTKIVKFAISKTAYTINLARICNNCVKLESVTDEFDDLKTISALNVNFTYGFNNCSALTTINLDLRGVQANANYLQDIFTNCTNLTNVYLSNIKANLKLGDTTWGTLITYDSLINTIKELVDRSSSRTLTLAEDSYDKIKNVYVKLLDDDGSGKLPCEVCGSTDSGAMLIEDYMTQKNWALTYVKKPSTSSGGYEDNLN